MALTRMLLSVGSSSITFLGFYHQTHAYNVHIVFRLYAFKKKQFYIVYFNILHW